VPSSGVKGVEVDGGPAGGGRVVDIWTKDSLRVLNLAFAVLLAGAARDGFHGRIERTRGGLDGGRPS
jgi:hypothetical protein